MTQVLHVQLDHPLNQLSVELKARIVKAQTNLIDMEYPLAADLFVRTCNDLRVSLVVPTSIQEQPVQSLSDRPFKELFSFFSNVLIENNVPEQAVRLQAANLAHRTQLLRAFHAPDEIVELTCNKVADIVRRFPTNAEQIQRGRNPGDVLDPYILAAAQELMYRGDFKSTVSATVAHKVLMMIEGLLGHLHEDVLGAMRGNVRAPEPRGEDQETLDAQVNPFPGADIVQPPLGARRTLRFHQVKSKTGSAKGGDGRRLGEQLDQLRRMYNGEIFYDALIGNTLRGHRSMAGVLRAAPTAVVLVGHAAFAELTGSSSGPELLLRVYQAAFEVAARRTGYRLKRVVSSILAAFQQRADAAGEGFLETILRDAITGPRAEQDSRLFQTSTTEDQQQ